MRYRKLGKAGIQLSVIGLGSYLTYGYKVDDETARRCIHTAVDSGVNFFDTANVYNRGGAEKALSRLLADFPRDSYVLATKVWGTMGPGPNDHGLSRKHIMEQCHASLRRLNTDYIDIYQCHRFDPETPLDETIQTMEDLLRQGKILYWGVSEWTAAQIAEANGICRRLGCRSITSNQPRYNLFWRYPELETFPYCQQEGIGQVLFSPLAHGILTSKYAPGTPPPPGTRAADPDQNSVMMKLYWTEDNLRRAARLPELARRLGMTPAQLSLAWCLRLPAVTSAITSGTRPEQIAENARAADLDLPEEILQALDDIFPRPQKPEG